MVLLAPLAVILALVSSQTGFNHHLRYVLPIFPFAFIWASKVARAAGFGWARGERPNDQGTMANDQGAMTNKRPGRRVGMHRVLTSACTVRAAVQY
jgi:hypothetical protein